jgi:hypothetical protein
LQRGSTDAGSSHAAEVNAEKEAAIADAFDGIEDLGFSRAVPPLIDDAREDGQGLHVKLVLVIEDSEVGTI